MKKIIRYTLLLILLAFSLIVLYLISGYLTLKPKPYLNYPWDNIEFSEKASAELITKKDFSIISFNAGLLDMRIHGETKVKPTEFITQRKQHIPAALLASDADVIAIQEVYEQAHIEFLIHQLTPRYPHYFFQHNSRWKLNNGLMFFSKYPLIDTYGMSQEDKGPLDEEYLADRSVIGAVIEVAGKRVSMLNMHATSGGTLYTNNDDVIQAHRSNQIKLGIDQVRAQNTDLQILIGDFNCGPNYSQANYDLFAQEGFKDTVLATQGTQSLDKSMQSTWDGGNYLNSMRGLGYDARIQERIDHIFISDALNQVVTDIKAHRIYDQSIVKIDDQLSVPLSDHYGLHASFSFQ